MNRMIRKTKTDKADMRYEELPEQCKLCKNCVGMSVDISGWNYRCAETIDIDKIRDGSKCHAIVEQA